MGFSYHFSQQRHGLQPKQRHGLQPSKGTDYKSSEMSLAHLRARRRQIGASNCELAAGKSAPAGHLFCIIVLPAKRSLPTSLFF